MPKSFRISLKFPNSYGLVRAKVKVPLELEVPVFLIFCELQNRMLFDHLRIIGFDCCELEHYLDRLILLSLDMNDGTDETFKVYLDLMDRWTKGVNTDKDVIARRALKVYHALVKARDRSPTKVKMNPCKRTPNKADK